MKPSHKAETAKGTDTDQFFFSHNITETIILLMEKGNTDLWREKLQNEWRVLPNN